MSSLLGLETRLLCTDNLKGSYPHSERQLIKVNETTKVKDLYLPPLSPKVRYLNNMSKYKLNNNHNDFLMTYFKEKEGYEELNVNGWWLVKTYDGNKKKDIVNVFSAQSYANYKRGQQKYAEQKQQLDFLKNL
jgi:hypothetical protein